MVSGCRQLLGLPLATIGFLATVIICALPIWKVTAFIGANIVTAQIIWEGLWMNCVIQSTGLMQCKFYDRLLELPQDLQAARVLVIISIVFAFFGILLGIVGGKCTNCVQKERQKNKVMLASGIVFITASISMLIPVCWVAGTIIRDFDNPYRAIQKRELGMSLYIGWASGGLLLLGGGLLCCSCPPNDETECEVKYSKYHSKAYLSQA